MSSDGAEPLAEPEPESEVLATRRKAACGLAILQALFQSQPSPDSTYGARLFRLALQPRSWYSSRDLLPRCRVAMLINGSRGDVQPIIVLALKLGNLGHIVRILTNYDLVPLCQARGLDAMAVYPDCQAVIERIGGMAKNRAASARQGKVAGEAWMKEHPDAWTKPELALKDFKPDCVIYSYQSTGPAISYELQNLVPAVPVFFSYEGPLLFHSYINMQPPRPSFLATSSLLDFEGELEEPLPRLHQTGGWTWATSEEEALPGDLLEFLSHGDRPVAIGWGSMRAAGLTPSGMLALALNALRLLGRRGVILGGWARLELLGEALRSHPHDLPEELAQDELIGFAREKVFFAPEAPHGRLFPRCSCVIHHGGSGTTHAALLAGCPCVITPISGDQFSYGRAVDKHGAGVTFEDGLPGVTAQQLADAVVAAESLRSGAVSLGCRLRAEAGLSRAALVLDGFLCGSVHEGTWRSEFMAMLKAKEEARERAKLLAEERARQEEEQKEAARAAAEEAARAEEARLAEEAAWEDDLDDSGEEYGSSASRLSGEDADSYPAEQRCVTEHADGSKVLQRRGIIEAAVAEFESASTMQSLKDLLVLAHDSPLEVQAAMKGRLAWRLLLQSLGPDGEQQQIAAEILDLFAAASADGVLTVGVTEEDNCVEVVVSANAALRDWWLFWNGAPDSSSCSQSLMQVERRQLNLERASRSERRRGPIPNILFPAAKVLANLILSVPELASGKSVLELGAGFHGLGALSSWWSGATRVLATDVDATALHLLAVNLGTAAASGFEAPKKARGVSNHEGTELLVATEEVESSRRHLAVAKLDWTDPSTVGTLGTFDLIVASEVIYEVWMSRAVLQAIERHLAPNGRAVIINAAPLHRFGAMEFQALLGLGDEAHSCADQGPKLQAHCHQLEGSALEGVDTEGLSLDCYVVRKSL